jgi:nucleotide-binding universal stress UspA family protein
VTKFAGVFPVTKAFRYGQRRGGLYDAADRGRRYFAEDFEQLERQAASQGVEIETRVAVGHPAEQILRAQQDTHADLIVMGRRGKTRATRWLLGSVSERVHRYAHCPVMVVK